MIMPLHLVEYIDSLEKPESNYNSTHFFETVELINNKITLRMFAIRYRKQDDKPSWKEVYRENEEQKWINTDLYYQNMAGWRVCWEEKCYAYYGSIKPENRMEKYKGKKPGVYAIHGWHDYEIRELDLSLKYMVINNEPFFGINIIEFIKRFRQYPALEILSKAGFSYFYKDSRVLKLQGKKRKAFVNYIMKNKDDVIENRLNYNFINKLIKLNMTYSQYREYERLVDIQKELSFFRSFDLKECKAIDKYLEKQDESLWLYHDYIKMANLVNYDLTDSGVLFPKALRERHDQLDLRLKEEKNQIVNNEIALVSNKLEPLQISEKGFDIFVPSNLKDFLDIANALHNCVYSCGYGQDVANGKCIIIAVRKDNEFIECCELRKHENSLLINQLRGDHNQDSNYHKQAEKMVHKFISLYKKNNVAQSLALI